MVWKSDAIRVSQKSWGKVKVFRVFGFFFGGGGQNERRNDAVFGEAKQVGEEQEDDRGDMVMMMMLNWFGASGEEIDFCRR